MNPTRAVRGQCRILRALAKELKVTNKMSWNRSPDQDGKHKRKAHLGALWGWTQEPSQSRSAYLPCSQLWEPRWQVSPLYPRALTHGTMCQNAAGRTKGRGLTSSMRLNVAEFRTPSTSSSVLLPAPAIPSGTHNPIHCMEAMFSLPGELSAPQQ